MSKIIIVDQQLDMHEEWISRLAKLNYAIDQSSNLADAKDKLGKGFYDLIILDPLFSPLKEFQLFDFIKSHTTMKFIPIIALARRDNIHDKARFFDLGADEVMTKPVDFDQLAVRIPPLIEKAQDFIKRALLDPLTKVYNRQFFNGQLEAILERLEHSGETASLAFIDADKFKSINDTYGHHVGDLVLQGLAKLLQNNLRSTDILARFGGEEFVILLPNTNVQLAGHRVEEILRICRQEAVAVYDGRAHYITFSAGVAEWRPDIQGNDWVKLADDAVYKAKSLGRNQVVLAGGNKAEAICNGEMLIIARGDVVSAAHDVLRNYKVHQAISSGEVRELLQDRKIDLVIVDELFPDIDPTQITTLINGLNDKEKPKLLYISPVAKEEAIAYLSRGFDGILRYPFEKVDLEIEIRRLV